MFEAQGNRGFVAFFMYEEGSGKSVWYAADGPFTGTEDGGYAFSGDLRYFTQGQPASSATRTGAQSRSIGAVQIKFSGNNAAVQLPGGRTIAGTRYDFGGLNGTSSAIQPEVGWYWNPTEGGRGYAIEVQNNKVFMAMFHYSEDGSPTWNVVDGNIASGALTNPFQLFAGGQSLTSAYRGPTLATDLGGFTLSFRNPCAGQLQLAGAPAVSVRRFSFGDLPGGGECRTVSAGIPDVPGVQAGGVQLQSGDAIYGRIDTAGDVDAYGINLTAGVTYRFDLQGASTGNGTLADPLLTVHDTALQKVAENNDLAEGQLNAGISFTPTSSGIYYLAAQANGAGTGTFLLSTSGIAAGLSSQPVPALSSYAGTLAGSLGGRLAGTVTLSIDNGGNVAGGVVLVRNPGVTLVVTGTVAVGGVVNFTATSPSGNLSFIGFLGPQGNLSGSWSDASGAGGVFVGSRSSAPAQTPQGTTCYDGNVANAVGADDPFYVNSWHLKNTGPAQIVSATQNAGALAGIDARVESVHKGGKGCTGKGVTVAIVDSGLELTHEDLAANVVAGKSFNFIDNSANPSPALKAGKLDHGTGVAGVAVARGWNGAGSRGTAPFAAVVGYNTVGTTILASNDADVSGNADYLAFGARPRADNNIPATVAFSDRANGVDIFNYSAGADYFIPFSISPDPLARPAQHKAFEYGSKNLRGGLGAVYIQSAGNAFTDQRASIVVGGSAESRACAPFRTNYQFGTFKSAEALSCGNSNHEPDGKPYAYQVAAMHNTGRASSYSSAGAANWITGFGGEFGGTEAAIISTDDSGCQSGANNVANKSTFQSVLDFFTRVIADLFGDSAVDPNCNYTGQMNGTSAAAPSVSGVAALILETNPKLNWQDVGYILAKTARKVDASIATGDRAVTFQANGSALGVSLDDPWLNNAAGFNFQSRYGFGLVDADAAVKLAANYSVPAGRRPTDITADGTTSTEVVAEAGNGLKNYRATVAFSDKTALSGQVRVDIAVTNTADLAINPGQLQFEIVNKATGTKSILLPAFTAWYIGGDLNKIGRNGVRTYRFHTNAFFGEPLESSFDVTVRSFVPTPAGSAAHALSFKPTVTSFSL